MDADAAGSPSPRRPRGPRSWALWSESRATVAVVLAVELAAMAMVLGLVLWRPESLQAPAGPRLSEGTPWWAVAAALVIAAVAHHEVARAVERIRWSVALAAAPRVLDFTSVWTFGAVLSLPASWAVLVIVVVYAMFWLRSWRHRTPLYRVVLNAASVVVAAVGAAGAVALTRAVTPAASAVEAGGPVGTGSMLVGIGVAMVVYAVLQQTVVVTVVRIAAGPRRPAGVGRVSAEEYLLETSTLCLGVLTALAVGWHPVTAVLAALPLAVLGRAELVRELSEAVRRDGRTGLLTAQAWQARAEQLLAGAADDRRVRRIGDRLWWRSRAAARVAGVLMVDVDHFKRVNDTYGHAVGDLVLSEVARVLRAAVRDGDVVARYGGEEFLVLLVDDVSPGPRGIRAVEHAGEGHGATSVVAAVAERVRAQVASLSVRTPTPDGPLSLGPVTVSVGAVAVRADAGPAAGSVSALAAAADAAVYAAKRSGRNCVRVGRLRAAR